MAQIKGITVKLAVKEQVDIDGFNRPIYKENFIEVEDVLIGEPTTDEIKDTMSFTGKLVVYTLGIPKGDTHDWTNTVVEFFGEKFLTVGAPIQGIEENIPLRWHKKVKVARYE